MRWVLMEVQKRLFEPGLSSSVSLKSLSVYAQ
jgi:hypothetical protein